MNMRYKVLIVDDEPSNRQLMRQILKDKYTLSFATDGVGALNVAWEVNPDLILLDVLMPVMDGYETCRRLKANPLTAKIPVIFVTAMADVEDENLGFEVGAVDYITKPVSPPIVKARVATHLALYDQKRTCEETVIQRTQELQQSQRSAIFMLGEAGHYNDTDTGIHIWRIATYSVAIAQAANMQVDQIALLELTAPMHDVGKIGIPSSILKKPAKLEPHEWEVIMTHSEIGYKILSKSDTPLFKMAADIAYYHHEKYNGTGYPKCLRGDEIPECARIVAIADVFDALTMSRPYKEAWPIEKALDEIRKGAGNHFDPHLVECFFMAEAEIRKHKTIWDQKESEQSQ
ncbi:MAG: response regulator [Nitrospirae bacterium]|nr:response regulator [Nitrospirota bacterium]